MKKVAIYPGSFNPWHDGHTDVLIKALHIFDEVVVALGVNPDKSTSAAFVGLENHLSHIVPCETHKLRVISFSGFLVDEITSYNKNYQDKIQAIVRGLRHGKDLEDERLQQYWNEDLAKKAGTYLPPTVYFVTDRNLVHISSSAIRTVDKIRGK